MSGNGTPVADAARQLPDLGVRSLPVCGRRGRFLGMVSDRAILERCVAAGLDPTLVRARSLVTAVPQTIAPDHPADHTVLELLFTHADGLPVVRHGRLVGMVGLVQVAVG